MNVFAETRAAPAASSSRDDKSPQQALVERMAADLVEADAFANLADAIRLLMWKGYGSLNIALHADNARQAAMQSVVAREMAQP